MSVITGLLDPRSPLGVVEQFYGSPVTPELAHEVSQLPRNQMVELASRLDNAYKLWLPHQSWSIQSDSGGPIAPFEPVFSNDCSNWATVESWAKCALLYFPGRLNLPDPIDAHLRMPLSLASTEMWKPLREDLARGLAIAAEYRQLVASHTVDFVALSSVQNVFEYARDLEIDELSAPLADGQPDRRRVYDRVPVAIWGIWTQLIKLRESTWIYSPDGEPLDFDVPTDLANKWGVGAAMLGAIPVCADIQALQFRSDLIQTIGKKYVSPRNADAARVFSQLELPAPGRVSVAQVEKLRDDIEEFDEFRQSFARVVEAVAANSSWQSANVPTLFQQELLQELTPRLDRLKRQRSQSLSLEGKLTGAFLLGAALVEAGVTGSPPVGSALAAAAGTLGWAVAGLLRGHQEADAQEQRRLFYSSLIQKTSS